MRMNNCYWFKFFLWLFFFVPVEVTNDKAITSAVQFSCHISFTWQV